MLFVLEKLNCKDVYYMSQMNVTSPPIRINPLKDSGYKASANSDGLHFWYQGFIGVAQSLGDDTGKVF
jgi:hypothetical protein